jgi:hypothetical protein
MKMGQKEGNPLTNCCFFVIIRSKYIEARRCKNELQ